MNSPLSFFIRCISLLDDVCNDVDRFNLDPSLPDKCLIAQNALMDVLVYYYSSNPSISDIKSE